MIPFRELRQKPTDNSDRVVFCSSFLEEIDEEMALGKGPPDEG